MSGKKLKDVAEALGVSVVTVSNALAGKKGVGEATAAEIRLKAEELGIDLTRYGKKEQSATIGVLVSSTYISVGVSFYWAMYEKTAYAASRRHCFTMLEIVEDESDGAPLPQILDGGRIDGLIVVGTIRGRYMRRILDAVNIPVVLLDFYRPEYECDGVLSNNYIGAYRAAQYLVDRGHREIGFIGTGETSKNIVERFMGFRKCLMENGIPLNREYVLRERDIETEKINLVLPESLPTAFFCSSDYAAEYLILKLGERGLSVPDDISVTSYDDYLYQRPDSNELTTYHVDMDRMAKMAVKLVLKKIRGEDAFRGVRFVDSAMVERTSVRRLYG